MLQLAANVGDHALKLFALVRGIATNALVDVLAGNLVAVLSRVLLHGFALGRNR
jgi:hypothetical protein